jgi:hypothetical protein
MGQCYQEDRTPVGQLKKVIHFQGW